MAKLTDDDIYRFVAFFCLLGSLFGNGTYAIAAAGFAWLAERVDERR